MNSVDRHLSADTKAATLQAMRSARKEILLVVEGDHDVILFSNMLGIPTSNIISCGSKEILMTVFAKRGEPGVDEGTIFIRDRDFDDVVTHDSDGVLILVTFGYDIEFDLLKQRLHRRIFNSFGKLGDEDIKHKASWRKLTSEAAKIGLMRKVSNAEKKNLDFKEMKYSKFCDLKTLDVDIRKMSQYLHARSNSPLTGQDIDDFVCKIEEVLDVTDNEVLCRGKDLLELFSIQIDRVFDFCKTSECTTFVLAKMIQFGATIEDFSRLPMYPAFKSKALSVQFAWAGRTLP